MTADSDTDSISLTSTVEQPYDPDEEFQVEKVLAERDEEGRTVYLVGAASKSDHKYLRKNLIEHRR